eukprot:CAMPEP_0114131432 /NCGR_PEP_ID=MMETSP0043_2-20121206/12550_1 /TAXON_ID=464988 /ORGANISM="Hemiselmis andersenii, Strain CCMP644" /LENGTH=207 /DNA_ID=CAMNT_0001224863 /DNA_START=156 /DNA_END=776 /DNA_ORIENTATION=-
MAEADMPEEEVVDLSLSGRRKSKAPSLLEMGGIENGKAATASGLEDLEALNLSSTNTLSSTHSRGVSDMGSVASSGVNSFMILGTPHSLMSTMADRGTPHHSLRTPSSAANPLHLATGSTSAHKPAFADSSALLEEEEDAIHKDPNAFMRKIEDGEELLVPSDCDLLTALTHIGSGGRVLVEPSTQHEWEGCLHLRAERLCIRGVRN